MYQAGRHFFEFDFAISPCAAPINFSPVGHIFQYVLAKAKGAGAFGADATAQFNLGFIALPCPLGDLPPGLQWNHQAYNEELGVSFIADDLLCWAVADDYLRQCSRLAWMQSTIAL